MAGILISGVQQECPGTNGGIEAVVCVVLRGQVTNRCVVSAAAEMQKGALPFGGVPSRIAAIRWWLQSQGCGQKRKADNHCTSLTLKLCAFIFTFKCWGSFILIYFFCEFPELLVAVLLYLVRCWPWPSGVVQLVL